MNDGECSLLIKFFVFCSVPTSLVTIYLLYRYVFTSSLVLPLSVKFLSSYG